MVLITTNNPRYPKGVLESHTSTPSLYRRQGHRHYTVDRFTHTLNRTILQTYYASFHYITKRQHTTPKSISITQNNIFCTLPPPHNTLGLLCNAGRCDAAAAPATLVQDRGSAERTTGCHRDDPLSRVSQWAEPGTTI